MIDYPNKLNKIFEKLNKNKIKSIIIGGYIRDKLLKKVSKDIDIEVYGVNSLAKLETLLAEFGKVNSVGKSFGVCKLRVDELEIDFSLPRTESKISQGHKGFSVETNSKLDFKTATSRRDFTINAIGYDIQEQKLLDPFFGVKDLQNKILRAVDIKKFEEDPLRVLRAVQFSARFELSVERTLFLKCRELIEENRLDELPKERLFEEIKKLLLKSKKPSIGIFLLQKLGGFKLFKELSLLSNQELEITLETLDFFALSAQKKNTLYIMLTLLTDKLSEDNTLNFLARLTQEKELPKEILKFKKSLETPLLKDSTDYDIYKLATQVEIESHLALLNALNLGNSLQDIQTLQKRAQELDVYNKKLKEILKGRDLLTLGLKPSKKFSEILDEAYEAQMCGEFDSHADALLWLQKRV